MCPEQLLYPIAAILFCCGIMTVGYAIYKIFAILILWQVKK